MDKQSMHKKLMRKVDFTPKYSCALLLIASISFANAQATVNSQGDKRTNIVNLRGDNSQQVCKEFWCYLEPYYGRESCDFGTELGCKLYMMRQREPYGSCELKIICKSCTGTTVCPSAQ
jgi:hypothetical protein